MAKERGLDTYVVFWSIFVSRRARRSPRRGQGELLPALLRAWRHVGDRPPLPARERQAGAGGVPGSRRDRRLARRGHGRHDPTAASAMGRRRADRGRAGGQPQPPREADSPRAVLLGALVGPGGEQERRRGHARCHRAAGRPLRGTDLGGDQVQLVARALDPEAREGARRRARRHLLRSEADQLQDHLAGAQRGLLRPALGRARLHSPAHCAKRRRGLRRRILRRIGNLHPRAGLLHRGQGAGRLEVGLRAPVAVLQALGATRSTTRRRRTRSSRRSSTGATGRRPPTCFRRTRWPPPRSCASPRSTTRLGLHALQRGLPGAAGRAHELHLRRPAHQPADDGPRLRLRERVRADAAWPAAHSPPGASRPPPWPTRSSATIERRCAW